MSKTVKFRLYAGVVVLVALFPAIPFSLAKKKETSGEWAWRMNKRRHSWFNCETIYGPKGMLCYIREDDMVMVWNPAHSPEPKR